MLNKSITKAYIQFTEKLYSIKQNQKGITSIEYGLIAAAIAVFIVAVLYGDNSFIKALQSKFSLLNSTVISAVLQ